MNSEFRKFAAEVGRDSMHIQGPGGNISVKRDGTMMIKASGTRLSEAERSDIFVAVGLPKNASMSRFIELPGETSATEPGNLRPSIETALHAVFPHRFVLHTHSVHALTHIVRADAEQRLSKILHSRSDIALVDYARPGDALADKVFEALSDNPGINVVLLKNHGLVIASETVDGLRILLRQVDDLLSIARPARGWSGIKPRCDEGSTPVLNHVVQRMALSPAFEMLAATWPLFPDQAVFLGPTISVDGDSIRTELFTVKKGQGVCCKSEMTTSALEQLVCLAEILDRQPNTRNLRGIGLTEANQLVQWSLEIQRRQQNR